MKRSWIVAVAMIATATSVYGASSGRSAPIQIFVSPQPPNLTASVVFEEPSGNRALDALEDGSFVVRLENAGQGDAYDVQVEADWEATPRGVVMERRTAVGTVAAGKTVEVKIPIRADQNVPDQDLRVTYSFPEGGGFDADPVAIAFETRAYQPPKLVLADFGIDDQSGNGQVEPMEIVEVTCRVQNVGTGDAARVTARVELGENVLLMAESKPEHDLGGLAPGEHRDVKFSFYTNKRIRSGDNIPLALHLREGRGRFEGKETLTVAMNAPQRRAQEVVVQGAARPERGEIELAGGLSVDVERDIPVGKDKKPNAVAVIIGNRSYRSAHVPAVEFADRDAAVVKEYLVKTLGFDATNIIHLTDATLSDFNRVFGTRAQTQGQLANWVRSDKSEVFVYYSGHGAPDTKSQGAYFVPSDADPDYIATGGYPLDLFWENLAKVPAKSLTVVLDTCFSGNVDGGKFLLRDVSPALLQVKAELRGPEGSTVMTSAGTDQVSNWYREKKHGLFTYWWLKGLQGDADQNRDGAVTVGEMGAFLTENVAYSARRISGREQTPVVSGQDDRLMARLR